MWNQHAMFQLIAAEYNLSMESYIKQQDDSTFHLYKIVLYEYTIKFVFRSDDVETIELSFNDIAKSLKEV